MSEYYRINVRFDLNDETQRQAVDFLENLSRSKKRSKNSFMVEAIVSQIAELEGHNNLLEGIREILREELQDISVTAPSEPTSASFSTELTAEEQDDNTASVLDDLEMFG